MLCICLIMISERVTLLKPFGRQHPPLILLNPQNNGLLHAGDCDRFLSPCSEGSVCLHTANTTMIAVKNRPPSQAPSQQSTERAQVMKAHTRRMHLRCVMEGLCVARSSVCFVFLLGSTHLPRPTSSAASRLSSRFIWRDQGWLVCMATRAGSGLDFGL